MSYVGKHALGQTFRGISESAPVSLSVALPDPSSVPRVRRYRDFDQDYMLIDDDRFLADMAKVLYDRKATDTIVTPRVWRNDWLGNGGWRIGEAEPFLVGLRSLWVRLGRAGEWWPGGRNEFNFGPNTDAEQTLRMAEPFYNMIRDPRTPLWNAGGEGFVRFWQADHLYKNIIRSALVRAGYLDRLASASVRDDSAMVGALHRWYNEARAAGRDVGSWAGDPSTGGCATWSDVFGNCFNFGPNTGDEVRLHSKLVADVLGNISPREATVAQAALKGAKIRPPVIGMLTNIGGKNRQTLSPATMKSMATLRLGARLLPTRTT